jgi:hypothetical protein
MCIMGCYILLCRFDLDRCVLWAVLFCSKDLTQIDGQTVDDIFNGVLQPEGNPNQGNSSDTCVTKKKINGPL